MKNKRKTLRRKQMGGEIKNMEIGQYDGDIIDGKREGKGTSTCRRWRSCSG
jgi:hypothetical protein